MDRFMAIELVRACECFLATRLLTCIRSGASVGSKLEEINSILGVKTDFLTCFERLEDSAKPLKV
jgi:hypothetical protein